MRPEQKYVGSLKAAVVLRIAGPTDGADAMTMV